MAEGERLMDLFNNLIVYVFQNAWIAFFVLNVIFFYYASKFNIGYKSMVVFFFIFILFLASRLGSLNIILTLIGIISGYFIAKLMQELIKNY